MGDRDCLSERSSCKFRFYISLFQIQCFYLGEYFFRDSYAFCCSYDQHPDYKNKKTGTAAKRSREREGKSRFAEGCIS